MTTDGRREVEKLTGQRAVPVLVTDDGEVVADSKRIVEWAEAHPAHRRAPRFGRSRHFRHVGHARNASDHPQGGDRL